jgi:hypothetical protein
MHCWAAVSHYIDYKGDWDVPLDLKRALSALSGLFYVADSEFEQFYAARIASKQRAEQQPQSSESQEINLDTVAAYIADKFPDRRQLNDIDDKSYVSNLVMQLKEAGYTSMAQIDRDITRASDAFAHFEGLMSKRNDGSKYFAALAAVRISLVIASPAFNKVAWNQGHQADQVEESRKFLRPLDAT